MANMRLALLFTFALVALIAPLIESKLFGWFEDSEKLRNRLTLDVLEAKEIESILKSLYSNDKDAKIGKLLVIHILDKRRALEKGSQKHPYTFEQMGYNIFGDKNCRRTAIMRHFRAVMRSDLNTVLNVCKFVDSEWMSYCVDNIKQVHKDEQQCARLGEKELEPEQVSEILDSIGDKKNVMFCRTRAESLSNQSPRLEDCLPGAVEARKSYLEHQNPILVSNLRNFDKALDLLLPFCARNIENVFKRSTASITYENKNEIWNALARPFANYWPVTMRTFPNDERTREFVPNKRLVNDSCKKVTRLVAHVKYIMRQAGTDLFESVDELIGDEWTRLDNACFYYKECIKRAGERWKGCSEEPNGGKFSKALQELRRKLEEKNEA